MNTEPELIQKTTFNPSIKTYILLVVGLYMILTVVGIPFLLIWFLGVGQKISKRYYENLVCNMTDRHLEYKKGVLFKVEKTIPLENIQDLTFLENPLLKLLDLRILKIETASAAKPTGNSDMKLIGIVGMQEFKKKVLDQRTILKTEQTAGPVGKAEDNRQMIALLTEIRDILAGQKNK